MTMKQKAPPSERKWIPKSVRRTSALLIASVLFLGAMVVSGMDMAEAQESDSSAASREKSPKEQLDAARKLMHAGKYEESLQAFEPFFKENPGMITSGDCVALGIVYTLLEDRPGHERFSRWALDKYAETKSPWDSEHAAKGYLVFPEPKDKELLAKSVRLAQVGMDNIEADNPSRSWVYLTYSMAKYRTKDYDEAAIWLKKTIDDTKFDSLIALALGYTVLNELARGDAASAAEYLQRARDAAASIHKGNWEGFNHSQIILKEMEAALQKDAAK
ncbi:MAG: hypothetical protein QGG73_03315 [Candidatus Hydrogenedentes bacterium]|nr:hypothetical protein [Candidatus Hydrogenedentota bacterium]